MANNPVAQAKNEGTGAAGATGAGSAAGHGTPEKKGFLEKVKDALK